MDCLNNIIQGPIQQEGNECESIGCKGCIVADSYKDKIYLFGGWDGKT